MAALVRGLWRLVQSWWRRDRIRVSSHEGRLLTLRQGCILVVRDDAAHVLERSTGGTPDDRRVLYHCLTRNGAAQLEVHIGRQGNVNRIRWYARGLFRDLNEEDVEVYANGGRLA